MKTLLTILTFTIILQSCVSSNPPVMHSKVFVKSKARQTKEITAFSVLFLGFMIGGLYLVGAIGKK